VSVEHGGHASSLSLLRRVFETEGARTEGKVGRETKKTRIPKLLFSEGEKKRPSVGELCSEAAWDGGVKLYGGKRGENDKKGDTREDVIANGTIGSFGARQKKI